MTHGSLFSGIGGFDLAAEWMGWENKFHCEWNEFGQKVLKHYWPKAESYDDITKTDFSIWREKIDILTGGFPCQPYSVAGKRKGKEDERHLWPEMLRAIREIQPSWVVGENVSGLVSWNGGLVFDEVQSDLEAQGYEVQPIILPACAVNAPHRRDRVWFAAYSRHAESQRREQPKTDNRRCSKERIKEGNQLTPCARYGNATNANGKLHKRGSSQKRPKKTKRHAGTSFCREGWQNFPTQSPICARDDGFSSRLVGITFPKWRNESIKAAGNAIVPQVAYEIFKVIDRYDRNNITTTKDAEDHR